LAFKGFVEGLPTWILSGGRYDKLRAKMGKQGKAVGFAVYLDGIAKLKA
jgi:ATP phosphoribosyltransferase regulatory subunit